MLLTRMLVMMIIWVGELEFLERWIGGKVPALAPLPSDTFTRGLPPQPVSILACCAIPLEVHVALCLEVQHTWRCIWCTASLPVSILAFCWCILYR